MKTYILIYDDFALFEGVLTGLFNRSKGEIVTVGITKNEVASEEGFKLVPHTELKDVDINDVDIFIIPGGNPEGLFSHKELYEFIIKLNDMGKMIAAICAGPTHLARAGILKGKKYTTSMPVEEWPEFEKDMFIDENCVRVGNIITAKGNGYVDFALEIGKAMNIFDGEEDYRETVEFFRNFRG